MARAKKASAAAPVANAADAATGAPANAGAPAQTADAADSSTANTAAGDPGNDPAQAVAPETEATQVVEVPGAAPAVVVAAEPAPPPTTADAAHALVTLPDDGEEVDFVDLMLARFKGTTISVTARKSRWRAGRQFGPEAVSIDTDELSDDELLAILKDQQLEVSIVA